MVVILEVSPSSTEELCSSVRVTIGFLVTFLTKARFLRLLSLARRPALGRVLLSKELSILLRDRIVLRHRSGEKIANFIWRQGNASKANYCFTPSN